MDDDSFSGENLDDDDSNSATSCDAHDSTVKAKLRNDLSKLRMVDDESNTDDSEDEEAEEEEDEILAQLGYENPESKGDFDEEHEEENNNQLTSGSLQPVSNLLSALKGSRSKDGEKRATLRVSWAPDVYDPIPTTPDQFASSSSEPMMVPFFVGGKKRGGGKGVREIEEGSNVIRGNNRFGKGGNDVRAAKGSRKERDNKKHVRRQGRDKKYGSYSNYEDD